MSGADAQARYRARHPDRVKAAAARYKAKDPAKIRTQRLAANLKHFYGLTLAQYNAMVEAQDVACKICRKEPGLQRLHVDHCHETGRIRGLLCGNCNRALGLLFDNPETFQAAARYLR